MLNSDKPASSSAFTLGRGNYAETTVHLGLTKREAFAMAAMQGWLSRCSNVPHSVKLESKSMAAVAVSMADALLKELDKQHVKGD